MKRFIVGLFGRESELSVVVISGSAFSALSGDFSGLLYNYFNVFRSKFKCHLNSKKKYRTDHENHKRS